MPPHRIHVDLLSRPGARTSILRRGSGFSCQGRRNPFNPQPLISHLTNSNGCGNIQSKVPLTVPPFRPSFLPQLAVHPENDRFLTPVFSSTSESLFSQLLCFHIYLRCPLLFSSVYSVPARPTGGPPASVPSVPGRFFKSFAVNGLPPLVLSCLSFSRSLPLFSVTCSLLLQNRGVGVSPRPLSPLATRHSPLHPAPFDAYARPPYALASYPGAFMLVRNFIFWLSTKRGVTNAIARRGMKLGFARRFVAGETLAEALTASRELCDHGRNVSLNHLGENVTTEAAAREVCASYITMVEEMHAKNLAGNISIKLTQLGLDIRKDL